MPKNKGKGGKNRRRGKNENEADKRELIFKEDGQGKIWLFAWSFAQFYWNAVSHFLLHTPFTQQSMHKSQRCWEMAG